MTQDLVKKYTQEILSSLIKSDLEEEARDDPGSFLK